MSSQFDYLIIGMDIPENRKHDLAWLLRNMEIRNESHPNFKIAYEIVKNEYRDWWRKTITK